MKILHISRSLLLAILITFTYQANCVAAEEEHTALEEQMEQIGRAWRTVKRGAGDASKNAQTLAQVKKMQAAIKASMEYKPAMLEDIPDAQKEKFLANFGKGMKSFATKIDNLAKLLEAGDNEAAAALITQIDNQRKKAHEAFKRPE